MTTGVATIGWLNAQAVIAAHVALRAGCHLPGGRHLMRVCQRKACGTVIELSVRPCGDRVTVGASRRSAWKARRHVIGDVAANGLRAVPRRLVATHAVRRRQVIVVVNVALGAGRSRVRAHKSEARCAVIESRSRPRNGVVAVGTI